MRLKLTALMVFLGLLNMSTPCRAQAGPAEIHALDRADLESWLDGLMPYAIESGDIAGAVLAVVKDGDILLEKGYGYADVARRKPMDPADTLIRPGSISKLFTWTAVMQLVESGRLDLDADVNRYLDFKIPSQGGKPITMRNLLTHTAGFEEAFKGILGRAPGLPLGKYLRDWVPEQIYPTGTVPAYSNYGAGLAGYIVERISAQPFESYVEQRILGPLGMRSSTMVQPIPRTLQPRLSKGYTLGSGPAMYEEIVGSAPAGGLTSTAHDMARFMIAHLGGGSIGSAQVLSAAATLRMHATQPQVYPALNGMALGFYETSRNGHRVIAHNGGTQFFHSDLHLFVDDGVGLFISLNSAGRENAAPEIHRAFSHGFADRYFPAAPLTVRAPLDAKVVAEHARLMAGAWESSRRSASNFMSLVNLLGPMTITANDDGTLSVPVPGRGVIRWRESEPFVWTEVDGVEKIQALTREGRPIMLGFGMAPPAAFLPIPGWRSPAWLMPALIASSLALFLAGISLPVAAVARRFHRVPSPHVGRTGTSHRVTRILGLSAVAVFAVFLIFIVYITAEVPRLSSTTTPFLITLQMVSLVVFTSAVAASLYDAWLTWSSPRSWRARVGALAIATSCATLFWAAWVFHLMKISPNY